MKDYSIAGKPSFGIDQNIKADNEEQALQLVKEKLIDCYHLNSYGSPHPPKSEVDFSSLFITENE